MLETETKTEQNKERYKETVAIKTGNLVII